MPKLPAIVVASILALTIPAGAQDLAPKVKRYAQVMAKKPASSYWMLAEKLKGLGPKVVDSVKPYLGSEHGAVRLASADTLIYFGEKRPAFESLVKLVTDEAGDLAGRRAAAMLLGDKANPSVAPRLKAAFEEALDPLLKLEIAKALWKLSVPERPFAKRALRAYLKSEDSDLRAAGALALAEFEDEAAKSVLEQLKDEPTDRGQLARSYLKMMDLNRQIEAEFYKEPADGMGSAKFELLDEILRNIKQYHHTGDRISEEELLEAAARNMLRRMDPHSTYFSAKQRAEWAFDLNKNYGGLGAFVNYDKRGIFTIIRPIYSGPAYEAGLRTDDKVLEVEGWSTMDRDLRDVIKRLKGPPGTDVKIKVLRRGWKEPREMKITRARIKINSVMWEMLPSNIGYVSIANFGVETSHELDEALDALNKAGMKGLILDLRNNQGGYLPTAIKVADKFLGRGKLVTYWEGRNRLIAPRKELRTTDENTQPDYPMVILTNDNSASASEIVAGALKYHKRARLVGIRTYGKGSVQKIMNLDSKPGDRFRDLSRKNGWYDQGESFRDENGNGRYDIGEPFEDQAFRNGSWDPAEPFEDKNGNGRWDVGEPYTDENRDGRYTPEEPYDDLNKNGKYDIGPGIKVTVGRYYMPDGRSIHKELDSEGVVIDEGGIEPDVEMTLAEWPGWKEEEIGKLLERDVFQEYVDKHWAEHKELLNRLAGFDDFNENQYPQFDEFMKSLDTKLPADDVRRWLRIYVRRRAMDHRAKEFIGIYIVGDHQEDQQLQAAILEILAMHQTPVDPRGVPEYRTFPEKVDEAKKKIAEFRAELEEEKRKREAAEKRDAENEKK